MKYCPRCERPVATASASPKDCTELGSDSCNAHVLGIIAGLRRLGARRLGDRVAHDLESEAMALEGRIVELL